MLADTPILFCIVTWMQHYDGSRGDEPSGGGSFIEVEGYGHEMFNLRPFQGRLYVSLNPAVA